MDVATARTAVSTWMTAQGLVPGSLERRFATGVVWSLGATVASQGLRMVAAVVTARLLGRVGMGELGMVLSTVVAFGVFAGFGLGVTATKYVAELRSSNPVRAGRILGLASRAALISSGLVSVALFAVADILAGRILNAPHLTTELRLGCVLLFLSTVNGVQVGALAGFEAYRQIARIEVIRGLTFMPLVVAGVWFFDVQGALAAHVVAAGVGCWLARAAIAHECARFGIVPSGSGRLREDMQVLRRFTIPTALSGVLVMPVTWLTHAILANQQGGYGELGLLSVANQWYGVLMFVPQALLQVALPLMSTPGAPDASSGEADGYSRAFMLTRSLTLVAVFPAGVSLMFLSSGVMGLYGRGFTNGGDTVLIGVISSVMIMAVGSAAGPALQAKGRVWFGLTQNASWGAVFVSLTVLAAPVWGAAGVAFSMSASYVFLAVWSFIYLRADLPAGTLRRVTAAVGFVVAVTFVAMALEPWPRTAAAVPAALITALATFLVFVDAPVRVRLAKLSGMAASRVRGT